MVRQRLYPVKDILSGNSSTLGRANPLRTSESHSSRKEAFPFIWEGQFDVQELTQRLDVHHEMAHHGTTSSIELRPVCFVRFEREEFPASANSSASFGEIIDGRYEELRNKLNTLRQRTEEGPLVEEGAVNSALQVIDALRVHQTAPPEISWHGGDAVVMLWAIGDTTYAITVTDGELGYVVRRNRKSIKMVDSIDLNTFRLSGENSLCLLT